MLLLKLHRQIIQQLRVRRRLSGRPKVFFGGHQSGPEQSGPDAIGHHAGRQRVVSAHQPLGQLQSCGRLPRRGLWQRRQRGGCPGRHGLCFGEKQSAFEHVRGPPQVLRAFFQHRNGDRLDGVSLLLQLLQGGPLLLQIRVREQLGEGGIVGHLQCAAARHQGE